MEDDRMWENPNECPNCGADLVSDTALGDEEPEDGV